MNKILFVFGTRPEAIKLAPVIHACYRREKEFDVKICLTGQHKEMLYQVMDFFQLKADYDLQLMKPDQTLFDITAHGLTLIEKVLNEFRPELVVIQGDTTTTFVAALAAFYNKIKVAHVEAGLRSGDKYSPFPEEINRKMTSIITDFHFAPTQRAVENLRKENIKSNIFLTGNTVIDALLWAVEKIKDDSSYQQFFSYLDLNRKIILITGHRRESFGKPFENICDAISMLANKYPAIQFVYPVHLNPNVQEIVRKRLAGHKNIFLIAPLDYPLLVWLLSKCYFVITDSGGIQEEAPSLGKPVLVIRNVTEREEGLEAGTAILVGTTTEKITEEVVRLVENKNAYAKMADSVNPYGDGNSAGVIVDIISKELQ